MLKVISESHIFSFDMSLLIHLAVRIIFVVTAYSNDHFV